MFDVYDMDRKELWEVASEMRRRGVPLPREIADRLEIVGEGPDSVQVSKESGPPYNPIKGQSITGGFLETDDPALATGGYKAYGAEQKRQRRQPEDVERRGPFDDIYRGAKGAAKAVKDYDTKGFGKGWNVDTRGVGKDWDKKAIQGFNDYLDSTDDSFLDPEQRFSDGKASIDPFRALGKVARGIYYTLDDVASGLGDIDTRGVGKGASNKIKEFFAGKGPMLPGYHLGMSEQDIRELGLRGPEDPERPVRDMEAILAGARNVWKQQGTSDTSKTYGVMASDGLDIEGDGLVGPPPTPPESVEEAVRQQAAPADPGNVAPQVSQSVMPRVNDQIYSQVAEAMPQMPQVTDEWYKQNVSDDEGPKGFFDKGGKLDSFFGALSGFSPSTPAGQAIMAASLGMMSAPGTYGNFGAAFGKGGLAGLEQYGEAKKLEELNAYKRETLDAQRKMAAQRNATEIWKATQANAGKMPEFAEKQMQVIREMAERGEVEAAQAAYDKNETLKLLFPNWKAGRIMKSDEILVNQLRSNPNFLREWLNNEIKKGSTGSPMHDLVRQHLAHWEDPENNPPLNAGQMNMLENYFRREGSASAAMGRGFEQYGMTTEEQVGKVREMATPTFISPPRPGQQQSQEDPATAELRQYADSETTKFVQQFMQKNGRTPSEDERKAFALELQKKLEEQWQKRGGR